MRPNNQFIGAIHILTLLTLKKGQPLTSHFISQSTGLNPVTVRKLLLILKEAGYVQTRRGTEGGTLLARRADEILLGDLYRLLRDEELYGAFLASPHPQCPVGQGLPPTLEGILAPPREVFFQSLQGISIQEICRQMMDREVKATPINTTPTNGEP